MDHSSIIADLQTLVKFVDDQQKVGRKTEDIAESQLLSMKSKIKGLKLSTEGALALTYAIVAATILWDNAQKSRSQRYRHRRFACSVWSSEGWKAN